MSIELAIGLMGLVVTVFGTAYNYISTQRAFKNEKERDSYLRSIRDSVNTISDRICIASGIPPLKEPSESTFAIENDLVLKDVLTTVASRSGLTILSSISASNAIELRNDLSSDPRRILSDITRLSPGILNRRSEKIPLIFQSQDDYYIGWSPSTELENKLKAKLNYDFRGFQHNLVDFEYLVFFNRLVRVPYELNIFDSVTRILSPNVCFGIQYYLTEIGFICERYKYPTAICNPSFLISSSPVSYAAYSDYARTFARSSLYLLNSFGDIVVADISPADVFGYCNWLSWRHGLDKYYTERGPGNPLSNGYRLPTAHEYYAFLRFIGNGIRMQCKQDDYAYRLLRSRRYNLCGCPFSFISFDLDDMGISLIDDYGEVFRHEQFNKQYLPSFHLVKNEPIL